MGGSLLEMEERCGHEVILKETEEGLSINPLSMRRRRENGREEYERVFPAKRRKEGMGRGRGKGYGIVELQLFGKVLPLFGNANRGLFSVSPGNKIAGDDECNCEEFRGRKMSGMGGFEFKGCGGGGGVFWDNRVLQLEEMEVGNYSVSCRSRMLRMVFAGRFQELWALCEGGERGVSERIGGHQRAVERPWCVAGDFNMIRFPSERSRGGRLSPSMRRFTEVIEELELRDLPLQGGMFTWSGGFNNLLKSRIDRFLISEDWEAHFRGVFKVFWLDQYQIILQLFLMEGDEERATPFRFENMWLKEEGFKEVLRKWWEGIQIKVKKQEAWNSLDFWDKEERVRELSLEEEEARKEAREMYKKWVLLEEMSWRQKSREIWLKEGDRNTRFFHQMANAHRRRNQMNRVKVNGRWYNEEREIKRRGLEKPFTEEEVFRALSGCCGEKAPGPDGFSMAFWQFSWDFVKEEVMNFFRQFHETGSFVRSLNATFLVFIPKKGGAEDLKDFRPISLVEGCISG
ncbi:hypothetical protein CK203_032249 [Vitis vinifera]|uniref:Endonuclease/exonuclease/phosphatase domain-containing protein n=1 Tax=Vitis vinifera TaxID=29760 RepID=A0A438IPW9_VITVI|nr:hypothetical protein CK203_032249 [Vitis vinifera]